MPTIATGMAVLEATWFIARLVAPYTVLGLLVYATYQKRPGIRGIYRTIEYGLGDITLARKRFLVYGITAGGIAHHIIGGSLLVPLILVTGIFLYGIADIIREPLEPSDHSSLKRPLGWLYVLTSGIGLAALPPTTPIWLDGAAAVGLLAIIFWRI